MCKSIGRIETSSSPEIIQREIINFSYANEIGVCLNGTNIPRGNKFQVFQKEVKVKAPRLKYWYQQKGLVTRNRYVQY